MITVETILRPFRYKKWYYYKKSLLAFPTQLNNKTRHKKVLAKDHETFTFVANVIYEYFFTANGKNFQL